MAKTRGRDQRGPMERLVKIAAYLKLAGEQGAPADKLIEIAGFEGEYAQRLLTRELGHLIKQGWQIDSIGEPGTQARYRSEEQTSELQTLMRITYDVLCMKKKNELP